MFQRDHFLAAVLDKAGSQAEIGRVLGIPSSRVSETFSGERKLKLEEAVKLSETYNVPITTAAISAEMLAEVLAVALTGAPQQWGEQDVQRLAGEVSFGLRMRQSFPPTPRNPDHPGAGADDTTRPAHSKHD